MVVDLAVEDDADRAVLVRHRLHRRFGEVDDREAPEAEPDAAVVGDPGRGAVGPRCASASRMRVTNSASTRKPSPSDSVPLMPHIDDAVRDRFEEPCSASSGAHARLAVPERDRPGRPRPPEERRDLGDPLGPSAEERVRAELDGDRPLGRVAQREARTPSADVSSCTPPESVSTNRASASRPRNAR